MIVLGLGLCAGGLLRWKSALRWGGRLHAIVMRTLPLRARRRYYMGVIISMAFDTTMDTRIPQWPFQHFQTVMRQKGDMWGRLYAEGGGGWCVRLLH